MNNGASVAVSVAGTLATCTAANNLTTAGGDKIRFIYVANNYYLLNQTFTVFSATPTTFVVNIAGISSSPKQF